MDKDNEPILTDDWVAFSVDTHNDGIITCGYFVDAAGNELQFKAFKDMA